MPKRVVVFEGKKQCSKCKTWKPIELEYYPHKRMAHGVQSHCRQCAIEWHRHRPDYVRKKNAEYNARNPGWQRKLALKNHYQLTHDDVSLIRDAQFGCCAGCSRELVYLREAVDHCHETGAIRGLLCMTCNMALGLVGDNHLTLARMIKYLEAAQNTSWRAPVSKRKKTRRPIPGRKRAEAEAY